MNKYFVTRNLLIILSAIVLTLLCLVGWSFTEKISFNDDRRDIADKHYTEHLNCKDKLSWFNYCRVVESSTNSPEILIIGDSLGLAFSEYFTENAVSHTYLGGGSCPMLIGLVPLYSNYKCSRQTDFLYQNFSDLFSDNNVIVIFVNSAAYINTHSSDRYKKAMLDSIRFLKELSSVRVFEILAVAPAPRPLFPLTLCLPRRLINDENCGVSLRIEQEVQNSILSQLPIKLIEPDLGVDINSVMDEYKDDLHLTKFGFMKYYSLSLNNEIVF